jgi:hypothetical protein
MLSPDETSEPSVVVTDVAPEPAETVEKEKRNSGRTGPTSSAGRAISSQNALKHGSCSRTLILPDEDYDAWLELLDRWQANYVSDNPLLEDFVLKTAQAEWHRIRCQREFNHYLFGVLDGRHLYEWQDHEKKNFELITRYLTTAERKFQRELRMLEQFYKTHCQPAKPKKEEEEELPSEEDDPMPQMDTEIRLWFVNNETGERLGPDDKLYPPLPNFKPEPIVPGVYPPVTLHT